MPRSLLKGAAGVVAHTENVARATTPSAALRWLRRNFSWCRSLPSSRGGE